MLTLSGLNGKYGYGTEIQQPAFKMPEWVSPITSMIGSITDIYKVSAAAKLEKSAMEHQKAMAQIQSEAEMRAAAQKKTEGGFSKYIPYILILGVVTILIIFVMKKL